jgi:hypothetical protein
VDTREGVQTPQGVFLGVTCRDLQQKVSTIEESMKQAAPESV